MREREARDVGTEPQDGVRWTSPEDGRALRGNQRPGPRSEGPKAENNINTNLVLPSGKPRCMPYYFKFMTPIYISNTCALGLGID